LNGRVIAAVVDVSAEEMLLISTPEECRQGMSFPALVGHDRKENDYNKEKKDGPLFKHSNV